jgi:hypothetical protein
VIYRLTGRARGRPGPLAGLTASPVRALQPRHWKVREPVEIGIRSQEGADAALPTHRNDLSLEGKIPTSVCRGALAIRSVADACLRSTEQWVDPQMHPPASAKNRCIRVAVRKIVGSAAFERSWCRVCRAGEIRGMAQAGLAGSWLGRSSLDPMDAPRLTGRRFTSTALA